MKTHLWRYSTVVAALTVAMPAFADVTLNATGGDGRIALSWTTTDTLRNVQVYRDTDPNPLGRQRVASLTARTRSYTDTTVVNGRQYWYWIKYSDAQGVFHNSNAGSATPTAMGPTPTPQPTPTPTSTPTPTPTPTPVPGDGGATCTGAVAAPLPLTINGAGEYCRVTSGTISEYNSWNMQTVEINGVTITNAYWNTWSATKLPAKINGNYYIRYVGKYPWSHLEVNGSGGSQPDPIAVTGVAVTPTTVTVKIGASASLSATISPANAGNKSVAWSSNSTGVATVNANGVVTGVAAGTAIVTATTADGGRTASATVTVAAQANSTIAAASTSFDKNTAKQTDLAVTMTLNGNALNGIRNGIAALVYGNDYTVMGNTVTLLKSYLARQAVGTLRLTFDFSAGNDPILNLGITDSSSASAPAAPTGLSTAVVDNGAVTLVWKDNSNNETAFRVERRVTGDATWTMLADTAANTQTYTDTKVAMGKTYDYRVYAINAAASSPAVTASATFLSLVQYGEQKYKEAATMKCGVCHGADGNGAFPLKARTAADFATLTSVIASTMPDKSGLCINNCAKGTAAYIIKMQTGTSLDENGKDIGGGDPTDPPKCAGAVPPSPRSLRLLTRQEYQNTVNDLLGLSVNLVNSMPAENRVDGFDNYVADNLVTGIRADAFHSQALAVAKQAVTQSWSKIVPCSTQDTACARQFIQTLGKKAYRRPLSASEQDDYLKLFGGNSFSAAVEIAIGRMLASPHFLYRSELGTLQSDGSYRLTPYETASVLSYLYLGSMPDDALFGAADQNKLSTPQELDDQAKRLIGTARAREQVGNFVGQWLLSTSPYALPDKDPKAYPRFTADVKLSMSNELIRFFNHVAFDSTQKFPELFNANYAVVNRTLADYYGLAGQSGTNYATVSVPDGTRTGIMTLGAVLSRYANSNESHPFKRGGFVYKRLLCDDLPFPANAGIVKAPKVDPNATTRERFDFHSKSGEVCWSCHKFIDAPGFAFENYDGAGQYRATENGRAIDTSATVLGVETFTEAEQVTVANLNDLSKVMASSARAAECVPRQYYRYATGKRESDEDMCALGAYLDSYNASGRSLKNMMTGIVTTPGFTLRRAK